MPGTIPAARQHRIDAIAKESRGARGLPVPLTEFVQAYYRGVDESDLRAVDAAALAAAAAGHLRFGAVRKAGRALVRVSNPELARDGWLSARTVVEVVTDDMPFLVDSLAMVLNGCGLSIHTMVHPVLSVPRDRAGRIKAMSVLPLRRSPHQTPGGLRHRARHRGRLGPGRLQWDGHGRPGGHQTPLAKHGGAIRRLSDCLDHWWRIRRTGMDRGGSLRPEDRPVSPPVHDASLRLRPKTGDR